MQALAIKVPLLHFLADYQQQTAHFPKQLLQCICNSTQVREQELVVYQYILTLQDIKT